MVLKKSKEDFLPEFQLYLVGNFGHSPVNIYVRNMPISPPHGSIKSKTISATLFYFSTIYLLSGMNHFDGTHYLPDNTTLQPVFQGLLDPIENNRIKAIQQLCGLSKQFPQHPITDPNENENICMSLLDTAFLKICGMVNDSLPNVRAEACKALGSFSKVRDKLLLQVLSKENLFSEKKENPASWKPKDRRYRKRIVESGKGSDTEMEDIVIQDSAVCGALVHGLEDEYQEVRIATINSATTLCQGSFEFAKKAYDYIIDMLNDEIDQVRLLALRRLVIISQTHPFVLDEEQVQIVLSVLHDPDTDIRTNAHKLLSNVKFSTAKTFTLILQSLHLNVLRYSQDKLSVFQCAKHIGLNDSGYLVYMVSKLLGINRCFLGTEAKVDDLKYIINLIALMNAMTHSHILVTLLPQYSFRHYLLLRKKHPGCFPSAKSLPLDGCRMLEPLSECDPEEEPQQEKEQLIFDYLNAIYGQVKSVYECISCKEVQEASLLLQQCLGMLKQPYLFYSKYASNAKFIVLYLLCVKTIIKVQSQPHPTFACIHDSISNMKQDLFSMDNTFYNLSQPMRDAIMEIRIFFHVLTLLSSKYGQHSPIQESPLLRCDTTGGMGLWEAQELLCKMKLSKETLSIVWNHLLSYQPSLCHFHDVVLERSYAVIHEPQAKLETPIKIKKDSCIPKRVPFEAEFHFIASTDDIAIAIWQHGQELPEFLIPNPNHFEVQETQRSFLLKTFFDIPNSSKGTFDKENSRLHSRLSIVKLTTHGAEVVSGDTLVQYTLLCEDWVDFFVEYI